MKKRGQLGQIITSVPVLYLIALVMIIFIVLTFWFSSSLNREQNYSAVSVADLESSVLFERMNFVFPNGETKNIFLFEALGQNLRDEGRYEVLNNKVVNAGTPEERDQAVFERGGLMDAVVLEYAVEQYLLSKNHTEDYCLFAGQGVAPARYRMRSLASSPSRGLEQDVFVKISDGETDSFRNKPASFSDLYFELGTLGDKLGSFEFNFYGKRVFVEYYYGPCSEVRNA